VTLYTTEKVLQPLAVTGIVDIDIPTRTLAVRLSELASGYSKLWWREGHAALEVFSPFWPARTGSTVLYVLH
jgi:hypothetical protein